MKVTLFQIAFFLVAFYPLSIQAQLSDSTKPSDFIPYCSNNEDPVEKPIHKEWVQTDISLIKRLNKLPGIATSLVKLKQLLPNFLDGKCNCSSATFDQGYGLKSTTHILYGGYGEVSIDALYYGDQIIKLRLTITNHQEIIEKYLMSNIKLPFDCLNDLATYDKIYNENLKKYVADSGRLFLGTTDTNYKRRSAINYFTDVLNGGKFQIPFYLVSDWDKTFDNLRYFIVNKDYKALEDILYCPSPTSRLFAARTLLYMKEKYNYDANKDIALRMEQMLSNAQLVRSGIVSCHINKFDYDYNDIVKNFEYYLKAN